MTTSTIKTIFNAALNLEIVIDDKSHDEILSEIYAVNGVMGRTSLRNLLNGVRPSVCGFVLVEKEAPAVKAEEPAPAPAPAVEPVEEPVASSGVQAPIDAVRIQPDGTQVSAAPAPQPKADEAPAPHVKPNVMNAFQALISQVTNSGTKLQSPATLAASTSGAATGLKAVRRDTKIDLMLKALMTPGGASFAELQAMLGWSEGAVSSYLHWEPQNKGYLVNRARGADGTLRYSLGFPDGAPNEILYSTPAAAPADKA